MVKLGLLELNIFYTITIHVLFLSLVLLHVNGLKAASKIRGPVLANYRVLHLLVDLGDWDGLTWG